MSDMLTQGRGARVKNPTTKLTIDNLVKPVLSSHRENIAAAEARKLPPTGKKGDNKGRQKSLTCV